MVKVSREKFKVYKDVFDNFTLRCIFKLQSQGHFGEDLIPVKKGKESNIFYAEGPNGKVIIKIHRLENSTFNKLFEYINADPRFVGLKRQRRKIIFAWAQREYKNLLKVWELGIPISKPITYLNHILVMGFVGDESPAPMLKDSVPEDLDDFANKVILNLKKLRDAGWVHGDLSEFNILNFKDSPCFIDFTQATNSRNPQYEFLFQRDLKIMVRFFKKYGVDVEERLLNILN